MKDGIEYFPVDVAIHRSAKLADLSLEELGLWVLGLSYCNDEKTDGFIPGSKVRSFGACGKSTKLAPELVKKGRWLEVEGGYQSVGFLDHNRSREEIEQAKAKKRAAGQAGGRASQKSARPGAQASARASARSLLDVSSGANAKQTSTKADPKADPRSRHGDPPGEGPPLPPDRPSGTQRAAKTITDDGVLGGSVAAWTEGISEGTGAPCTTPTGGAALQLVNAVNTHFGSTSGQARLDAVRTCAKSFAEVVRERGGKVSPFAWIDWLNSGNWSPEDAEDEVPEWTGGEASHV